jgi:uncharacterized lipoprotein NlpE involved in copper resistance
MCYRKLSHQLTVFTVILFFLVGCSASAETSVSPTAIPPTPTPAPTPVLVTSTETLIGHWQPLSTSSDAMFLQINSDGTCRQSYSLDGLNNIPQVECTYTFEDSNLSMTAVKLHGVPACSSPTGKYEVRVVADNQIKLVATEDTCAPRRRSTQGVYQRIP